MDRKVKEPPEAAGSRLASCPVKLMAGAKSLACFECTGPCVVSRRSSLREANPLRWQRASNRDACAWSAMVADGVSTSTLTKTPMGPARMDVGIRGRIRAEYEAKYKRYSSLLNTGCRPPISARPST